MGSSWGVARSGPGRLCDGWDIPGAQQPSARHGVTGSVLLTEAGEGEMVSGDFSQLGLPHTSRLSFMTLSPGSAHSQAGIFPGVTGHGSWRWGGDGTEFFGKMSDVRLSYLYSWTLIQLTFLSPHVPSNPSGSAFLVHSWRKM